MAAVQNQEDMVGGRGLSIRRHAARVPLILVVLLALFAVIAWLDPNFLRPPAFLAFIKRSTPLMVMTVGEVFALLTGGLDLTVGAVVNFVILGSALLLNGQGAFTFAVMALMILLGGLVGVINASFVNWLRVPSIIVTIGMAMAINGLALLWSGGSAPGYLPDNYRAFGRANLSGVGFLDGLPISILVLLGVVVIATLLLHGTGFGRLLLSFGDNPRAVRLAGAPVSTVRMLAFAISGMFAAIGGILLGGFSGPSTDAGSGMELQAISASVIGGVQLLGGKGSVGMALTGSLTLQAIFTLLNLAGLPKPLRDAIQGLILIGAVAIAALRRK